MPKRATYRMSWSEEQQRYEMTTGGLPDAEVPQPLSSEWVIWLSTISSFAFSSRSGAHYTARKEQRQRGDVYWYGYRSHLGKTIKHYIGKSIDLLPARLEEVATLLTGEYMPSVSGPAARMSISRDNSAVENRALSIRPAATLASWEEQPSASLTMPMMPLLTSKLHPPHLPASLVARPEVGARLDAGIVYKLTLLSTPAGFGKTTAVNQWLTEHNTRTITPEPQMPAATALHSTEVLYRNTAWVSLDEGDNDPARFWRYLIAACQHFHADLGRSALALLFSPLQSPFELPSQEMMLTFLLNDITHYVNKGLLILDDYHVISELRIHDMMTFFIDHLPASLHVIVMTRSEPPLPLVRWRASGNLYDIQTAALRFSSEETTTFLQQAISSVQPATLSEEALAQFVRSMEGWAAGLRLLLLTLPRQAERSALERHVALLAHNPDSINGHSSALSQRVVVEYFVTEVLNAQSPLLQHFLLQTSVLSRLTGSLCDTVTGQQNGTELLEVVERAGLFLEVLEGSGQGELWYRYHALFAEAMRREALVRLGEEHLRALARSASHWYEQHEMLAEAVDAALNALDFDWAAALIECIYETARFYEMQTLLRWLSQIPETILTQHPELYFHEARALLSTHGIDETIPLKTGRMTERLQMAEDKWRARGNKGRLGEVIASRALAIWWRGETDEAAVYARQALDLLFIAHTQRQESTEKPVLGKMEWRSICFAIIGTQIMGEGKLDEARQALQDAHTFSNFSGITRSMTITLASILLLQGDLSHATEYLQQMLAEARMEQDWGDMASGLHGLMSIDYEWNDLLTMERRMHELEEINMQPMKAERREMAQLYAALLLHLQGETREAQLRLKSLLAALELIQSPTVLPLLFEVQSWQIRFHLVLGDLTAAQRSLLALSRHKPRLSTLYRERWQLLQARVLLAQGEPRAGLLLLEELLTIARAKQRTREMLEIQVQIVLAHTACRRGPEARQLLLQTLKQAQGENYLRLFLDEGTSLAVVLRALLPTVQEKWLRTYVQHILQTFSLATIEVDSAHTSAALLIEPLSTQERRVLRLLIAGQTNPEMARELVVSVNTIKDHVKNLYRKLQVNNRLEASEVARRLKLS